MSFSGTIPVIFIDTKGQVPITSKTEYVSAQFRLDPMGNENIDPVGTEDEPLAILP